MLKTHAVAANARLRIVYRDPHELVPRAQNPRSHSKKQIKQITASILVFGFVSPVLVDRDDKIIVGHARREAAIRCGLKQIPTIRVDNLTPAQIQAYVIADNRLAELAGWDSKLLALELQELSVIPGFDVTVTGFETGEIDFCIGELESPPLNDDDLVAEPDRVAPAITKSGDLWKIGNHRLLCGSALERGSYKTLLGRLKAQLVFIDPPYNVQISGNVSGLGRNKHREFAMASGEMSKAEFTQFLQTSFERLCEATVDGSIHFVCMDWRHTSEIANAAADIYSELKNICVWSKTNAGMGSFYRSQHEFVFVFKNGTAPHINNIELGRFGRNRSNVWRYAGANSFGEERDARLAMHPTTKPVSLVVDAIMDCSDRGALVLDAFAGSGTTLIAAEKTGRRGYGIELDPHYCDTILRRFETCFGLKASHAQSNKSFSQLERERRDGESNEAKDSRKTTKHKSARRDGHGKDRPR